MPKRIAPVVFASILMFAVSLANAQHAIDSLENKLKDPLTDSLQIRTLVKLSEEYQYVDFSKSLSLANEVEEIADQKGWEWAMALGYTRKSYLSSLNGDFITALKYDRSLLTLVTKAKDSTQIADCLNFLGFDYQELGEFDEAYYYFSQTFRISNALHDSVKIARSYLNLASVLKELGQYEDALNYLALSQKISSQIKDHSAEPYILDETGDVYQRRNQLDKAEKALLLSIQLTRSRKEYFLEPDVLQKLGEVSLKQYDFERALAYYDSANTIYRKSNNIFGIAQVKLGRGKVFLKQEKLDSALRLFEESKAIAYRLHAKKAEADCLNQLAELAELTHDYKHALEFYKLAKAISDSIVSRETLTRTFQNQLRFETENRDAEIASLTSFKKQQIRVSKQEVFIRNILVVAIALTAIVLFTVYRSGQRRLRINRLLLEHQEEIKQRAVELDQLNKVKDKFFSIISHDLKSPINSLSSILYLMENKNLNQDEFNRLIKELRLQFNNTKTLINNLLDWALMQMDKLKVTPEKINLSIIASENYKLISSLQLKEISFVNNINQNQFGFADANMINLVFRNLIMNALKFTETGGTVSVDSIDKGSNYEVCVADNGVGISPEIQKLLFEKAIGYTTRGTSNEKGTGLGLILCKEFIERNGGKIWVESELGKGSKFYFTILKPVV